MKKANLFFISLFITCQVFAGTFNILDFGAKGDGVFVNTKAINDAVNKCFESGGGTVVVPAGTFVTGTIILKSNIDLHLEPGVVLSGSENLDDYSNLFGKNGIIFCEDAINVSISGKGTIHGNGIKFYETDKNHEGINLLFFKKLFEKVDREAIQLMVINEPLSQYSRKIWFLYEWLLQKVLDIPDLKDGNYIPLINEKQQYALSKGINSTRNRILNNLPGTINFCPLITKTQRLENFIKEDLSEKTGKVISGVHRDVLLRTSAFLLLKDSKASFSIEGEVPSHTRASRWGNVIGQAETKELSGENWSDYSK